MKVKSKQLIDSIHESPYLQVNALIAGIIILIMIYSGIFSASGIPYPIKSYYSTPVASTGLSRAFSEIVRGNIQKAVELNPYSIKIFSFFFLQFPLRILISVLLLSKRISSMQLIFIDVLVSVLLFLWAFYSFIFFQLNG
jgi:hypothetical protein